MQRYLNTTHHAAIWFKKASESNELVIKAPFQRNPVWSRLQQSALIDSMLLEYPIPEVYMQEITDEGGNQKHVLVDGQQRIRAVLAYIGGDLAIEDENSQWNGLEFEDLSPAERKRIYEYSFVVRLLPDMSEEEIRAIFQRLNRYTTTLNQQELRHATYWGPFIKLMEEFADLDFWAEFSLFSAMEQRRMLDVEYISELAVAVMNGMQNKKKTLEQFYQIYETSFEDSSRLKRIFLVVLGELSKILPDLSKSRWRKKSDFYTLFLIFAANDSALPLPSNKRLVATEILTGFGRAVDDALAADFTGVPDPVVFQYARNVERAASDLGSRKERELALSGVLATCFQPSALL